MARAPIVSDPGLVFFPAPSRRQRMARRRVYIAATFAGIAILSAAIGAVSERRSNRPAQANPISYVPFE